MSISYVSNTGRVREATDRCDDCFYEGGPLSPDAWPEWQSTISTCFATGGVYEIADEKRRICQIGSGGPARVRSRVRSTLGGRFTPADSIWWLWDMLGDGRKPVIRSLPLSRGETPAAAEERWREARRIDGWQVSSDT